MTLRIQLGERAGVPRGYTQKLPLISLVICDSLLSSSWGSLSQPEGSRRAWCPLASSVKAWLAQISLTSWFLIGNQIFYGSLLPGEQSSNISVWEGPDHRVQFSLLLRALPFILEAVGKPLDKLEAGEERAWGLRQYVCIVRLMHVGCGVKRASDSMPSLPQFPIYKVGG